MPKPRILNSWPFSRRRAGLALESLEPRQMLASYAVNFNRIYANGGLGAAFSVTGTLGPGAANQANWNNIAAPQSVNSPFGGNFNATITDNSGQNGLTLHTVFANHEGGNDGGGVPTNDFESLYFTGMRLGDLSIHITTDVAPYRTYDLYIYNQHGDSFSVNNAGAINVSGRTSGPLGNDFVLNRNYTIVPGLTGPLDLWAYDAIQGFSIVAPPPETIQVTEAIVNPGASAIDISSDLYAVGLLKSEPIVAPDAPSAALLSGSGSASATGAR